MADVTKMNIDQLKDTAKAIRRLIIKITTEAGSGQFTKTGTGTLILTGTNTYSGGTIVSQGTLQGSSTSLQGNITDNGSLIFNQTANGTYTGNLTGSGDLIKMGNGKLIFAGLGGLTSTTVVTAGDLQVNTAVAGPVEVTNSSATLSGVGTVGAVTNNGFVQPGTTNIGTLTVNGNYSQLSNGTLQIKVNSTGNTPGVNNDNLNVSGQAQLGGALSVTAVGGGTFTAGTQYTILNATGGVTGQFAQASTNLSMFGLSVIYGPNDVTFELKPTSSLQAAAQTGNQTAVGTALDNIALTSTGSLFAMINTLGSQSPAEQRQAMNQLSGEVYGNLQTIGLQIGDQFQQRVTNVLVSNGKFLVGEQTDTSSDGIRGQSPSSDISRGWFQGFGVGGSIRSDGNGAGTNYTQGGTLFGVDMGEDETGKIGIAGGTSFVGFNDGFAANGQITAYQFGGYFLKHDEISYVLGTANYGFNTYTTNRNVDIAGVNQTVTSLFDGAQIGASGETGLKLPLGPFEIQPLIGLQYLYLCQEGLIESGGPAALTIPRTRANSLRANIGARLIVAQWLGPRDTIWTPYSHARFVTDLLDNDRIVNATFNGAPIGGNFTSQGTRIGQSYGVLGQGLEIRMSEAWSIFGGADIMEGDRITIATGSIGSLCRW